MFIDRCSRTRKSVYELAGANRDSTRRDLRSSVHQSRPEMDGRMIEAGIRLAIPLAIVLSGRYTH